MIRPDNFDQSEVQLPEAARRAVQRVNFMNVTGLFQPRSIGLTADNPFALSEFFWLTLATFNPTKRDFDALVEAGICEQQDFTHFTFGIAEYAMANAEGVFDE